MFIVLVIKMPQPEIHEDVDLEVFGQAYPEVHKWIDGTFDGTNGRTHWVNRHYVRAVLEHFNLHDYPDKQRRRKLIRVAKLHIMFDWAFYYHRVVCPYTRQDVINELRSEGIAVE
jgi:hypothetical protein